MNEALVGGLDGKRRAFISLGMHTAGTSATQCDIGIGRDTVSGSWYATSFCRTAKNFKTSDGTLVRKNVQWGADTTGLEFSASGNLVIDYTIGNEIYKGATKDFILGEFKINGSVVASIRLRAAKGGLFQYVNNKPEMQFIRFMSMCPIAGESYDDADKSTMSAAMHNLQLFSGASSYTWDASRTEHAWVVQRENAVYDNGTPSVCLSNIRSSQSIGAAMDYARFYHNVQRH